MSEGYYKSPTSMKGLLSDPNAIKTVLPVIFRIFEGWGLTEKDQLILLGLTDPESLREWRREPEKCERTSDLFLRISCILGIFKSLEILFIDARLADKWIVSRNDNPMFSGSAPIARLRSGLMEDLVIVREFLDSVRHGEI